jgi:hypothetical protein
VLGLLARKDGNAIPREETADQPIISKMELQNSVRRIPEICDRMIKITKELDSSRGTILASGPVVVDKANA